MGCWPPTCLTKLSRSQEYEPRQAQPRFGALIDILLVVSGGDNYPADEAFGPFSYPNLPQHLGAAVLLNP